MSKLKPLKIDDGKESRELMEAIDELPLMHKMVFKLRAIENHTYVEIAEELEISESKSELYYTKAKTKLKPLLENKMKKEKNIIQSKWEIIKEKSKSKDYDLEELDYLTCDLITHLAKLTEKGITEVEGISVDLYKDRVWWVVENIGLLPEYRDEDVEDILELIKDEWEEANNDEFDFEVDDSKFYR
jgi:hypothetical protein